MPPTTKKAKSSNPEVLRLTQVMRDYYVLIENCSARIRYLPDPYRLYEDALEKYMKNPSYVPAKDEQARKKFFSSVDEICKTEPSTPEEYVLNS